MCCPHPCCDAALDSETALRFHFVDDHGFSRTDPREALSRQLSIGECDEKADGSRKRKKSMPADDENTLQWIPSAPLETAGPLKKSRTATPTVFPSLVFGIDRTSEESRWLDPPGSTTSAASPVDLDSTQHHCRRDIALEWLLEAPLLCEPLLTDPSVYPDNDDGLFSQFIHSPSPTCPPSPTGDHADGVTAALATHPTNIAASASSVSARSDNFATHRVHHQDQNSHVGGPRLRHRVSPPKKIILRLRPKLKNKGLTAVQAS
jgi:hypothetical protein